MITRSYTGAVLIGRDAERLAVDALVAGARLGRSGVLVVTGEAGIGKTTLLGYAREAAAGVRLLTATGTEGERDVPFGGLAQLLRLAPDDLDGLPPPQAQALGVALALRDGPVVDRLAVGAAVLSLLTRWSEDRPLGVLVDDAHLLDRPSDEALAFAFRRFLADRVFALVAARPDLPGALTGSGLDGLRLTGLDPAATADLVRAGGGPATPERTAFLHRVTGGNPLAVLELGRDPGLAPAPESPVPVPAVLTAWFGRRLRPLGEDARTLLLLASIAGGELLVVSRAAAALGLGLEPLAEAERAGLVTTSADRVAFVHPLVRAAVYAAAYPDERRRLHAAVAEAVPAADVDRRTWHRSEAAFGPDPVVAADLEATARRAAARGAHAVAATALERAAALSSDPADRARRLFAAGAAAWSAGEGDRAAALLAQAETLDPSAGPPALALRGEIAARRGAPDQARSLFLAAAERAAGNDPSRAVLLLGEAVYACWFLGDAAAAVAAAERGAALLRAGGTDAVAGAVGTLSLGMARVLAGRSGVAEVRAGVHGLDALPAAERAAVGANWLMLGAMFLREAGTGRSLVRIALDEGRARSAVGSLPGLLFVIARDAATTDHWAAAEADYAEGVALARELGHTTELAMLLAGLAWLQARLGRDEECRAHAAETLELCARHPVNIARVWAEWALGEADLAAGDVPAAVSRFRALAGLLVQIDLRDPDLSPAPELAEALLRQGDEAAAREVAAAYAAAAGVKGQPWALARSARVHAQLGGATELDDRFGAALALHARTPDGFEEARTRLAYGSRLRRARRRVDARPQLRAALDTFTRLGAAPWTAVAAAELEATGESVPRPDAADTERLTARELQIALLLAEGRTTREAAAALFLSPKTVEYHLRHVYTKLGVASRTELTARLGPSPARGRPHTGAGSADRRP